MLNLRKRAFTLIELLVVIAIIAILAAILFPVFAQAKSAAKKTQDISNFKQMGLAQAMYTGDWDGFHMMSNTGGIGIPGWGYGPPDTVPGQQMMPYVKNTLIHVSPMDPMGETGRVNDHAQYMSSPMTPEKRMYALMVRSNIGYNYGFFSPWRYISSTGYVGSAATSESGVGNPANTLMFASSIWDRVGGQPFGGGNWVVETPCWRDSAGNPLNPFAQYHPSTGDGTLWSYGNGWSTNLASWNIYGGLWPWHNQVSLNHLSPGLKDGHVVIAYADSHVKTRPILTTTDGCTAWGTGSFAGTVLDKDKFIWDLE